MSFQKFLSATGWSLVHLDWFFFPLKDLVYCGNNLGASATYEEMKSVVHPSESQSPLMWRGKARLGDLRTARHVGSRARWELEPRRRWLKTYNKFMSSAQTQNYPRDNPSPSRQPCSYPSAPALDIPFGPCQCGFTKARRRSRWLLTWTQPEG